MILHLKPIEANEILFQMLEKRGVIRRLKPTRDRIKVNKGDSAYKEIYHSDEKFGAHKLIAVTTNNHIPTKFVYHNDREEFLIIDHHESEALVLIVANDEAAVMNQKIETKSLSEADFTAVILPKNHPEYSFFTMNPKFAHTEVCLIESDNPPSFYVTEALNIDEIPLDLMTYKLRIDG